MRIVSGCLTGLIVGVLGSVLLFFPLLSEGPQVLWADDFDSRLISWVLEWGYHIIFEAKKPSEFWNANSFYPHQLTLAYSDSLLSGQLFYGPLRLLGVEPLTALYVMLAFWCILGCLSTDLALSRIGGFSGFEKAIIIFSAHFGLHVIGFLLHYQLFGFQLAPGFLLFLYLYLRDWKKIDLLFLCLLYFTGFCYSMYLAPILFLLSVLAYLPFILRQLWKRGVPGVLCKIGLGSVVIVLIFSAVVYFIQLKPYFAVAGDFPEQSFEETAKYSARPLSLFNGITISSKWYGPSQSYSYGDWERTLFPGCLLLLLSGAFLPLWCVAWLGGLRKKSGRSPAVIQEEGQERGLALLSVLLIVCCLIFSLGPYLNGNSAQKLPFYYFSELFPGLRSIRAPGRIGMLVGLPLGILSVLSLRYVGRWFLGKRFITIAAFVALVVEALPAHRIHPLPSEKTEIYQKVAEMLPTGSPLLELPVVREDHFETLKNVMRQLNASTIHWGRLLVGYGAKTTAEYSELVALDISLRNEAVEPYVIVAFAQKMKVPYVLIRTDLYEESSAARIRASLLKDKRARILFNSNDALFMVLRESDTP